VWKARIGVIVAAVLAAACDVGPLTKVFGDAGPKPPERDAGRDAGPLEAGRRDGGPRDAGPRDAGTRDGGPRDGGAPRDAGWLDAPDDLTLYLNLGDAIGDGDSAGPDLGYADLLCVNHDAYPAYASASWTARYPNVVCETMARDGWRAEDVAARLGQLPASPSGDTIVTIHLGWSDFTTDFTSVISETATRGAIARWEVAMTAILAELRRRYEDPNAGRELAIVIATFFDTTDGTGEVPARFDTEFCRFLHGPQWTESRRMQAVANHERFNDAIRTFAQANDLLLLDEQALMAGHGMNAPEQGRWVVDTCDTLDDRGHHELRREAWRVITGELY
jgi:hypothetical protein